MSVLQSVEPDNISLSLCDSDGDSELYEECRKRSRGLFDRIAMDIGGIRYVLPSPKVLYAKCDVYNPCVTPLITL